MTSLPEDLTPLNLKAYFHTAFGACGCSELDEMHATVLRLLEWHSAFAGPRAMYDTLYSEVGVFYLLAGRLDSLGLAEHGTSIRHPWLTGDGQRLLAALHEHSADEIEAAQGEAYDGCYYE
jgi:hypothetical protein